MTAEPREGRRSTTRSEQAEARLERSREQNRRWKAEHPEKVKEYRDRFRAAHREQVRAENRERERAKSAKARRAREAAERRRAQGRERYAADPDAHREYQRQRRNAQRAADPEGYREAKKLRNKRWRDGHREEQNERLRAKHRENPEAKRDAAARYYAGHGDEVRERRRAYYRANREKQLEKQREWREREKRRLDAGLPPRRVHRVTAAERTANSAAADAFFNRARTPDEVAELRREPKTSARDLARWKRASEQARLADRIAADTDVMRPVSASERRTLERAAAAKRRREADAAEEARLDAVARAINDQLRRVPRMPPTTRPVHAPLPPRPSTTGGLSL